MRPKGNNGKPLTREQIEAAFKATGTHRSAARFLSVSYTHYKKYASLYKDPKTGLDFYSSHLNRGGKGLRKFAVSPHAVRRRFKDPAIVDVVSGRIPAANFNPQKIKYQLIRYGMLQCECDRCGFKESREIDGKSPLILYHKNGNKLDWHLDNLGFLCYNCAFLDGGVDCPISEQIVEKLEDNLERYGTNKKEIFELDNYQQEFLKTLGENFK